MLLWGKLCEEMAVLCSELNISLQGILFLHEQDAAIIGKLTVYTWRKNEDIVNTIRGAGNNAVIF